MTVLTELSGKLFPAMRPGAAETCIKSESRRFEDDLIHKKLITIYLFYLWNQTGYSIVRPRILGLQMIEAVNRRGRYNFPYTRPHFNVVIF
jgi:hypothetical protein